jgi:hypothetical protein
MSIICFLTNDILIEFSWCFKLSYMLLVFNHPKKSQKVCCFFQCLIIVSHFYYAE